MRRRSPVLAVSLALFLTAAPLVRTVAGDTWVQTNGPGVTGIHAFVFSGGTLYAGTDTHGVYRSTDLGSLWAPSNSGIEALQIGALAQGSGGLYAGATWETGSSGGVYRSADAGETWTFSGLTNETVSCFLPGALAVYAGALSGSVFRTTDQGASWTSVSNGLFGDAVYGLASSGGTLFAACGQGLFRSTDQAASWAPVSGFEFFNLFSMAQSGPLLFAGGFNGVLRSTNGGVSWSHVDIATDELLRITSFAFQGSTVYASSAGFGEADVFRSADQGASWSALGGEVAGVANDALFANGSLLLAGGPDKGVLATTNGADWSTRDTGLPPGGSMRSILVDGSTVYAGTAGNGVWKSADQGDTWVESDASDDGALTNELVPGLAARAGALFAVTSQHGIYRSTDAGATWQGVNVGIPTQRPFMLAIAVAGPNVVAGSDAGIFRSNDNGATWERRTSTTFSCDGLAFSDGFAYAIVNTGFGSSTGIYRSSNNGENWSLVFPAGSLSLISVAAEGAFAYAGDLLNGMVRSADHGTTWNFLNPIPGQGVFAVLPHGNDLFIGSGPESEGAYRSTDHGGTWTPWGDGLVAAASVEHLGADAEFVYGGTDREAIWRRALPGVVGAPGIEPNADLVLAAFPNPFEGAGVVTYHLAVGAYVRLDLVDVRGRRVRALVEAPRGAGWNEEPLDLSGVPRGVYFIRLRAPGWVREAKVVLVR